MVVGQHAAGILLSPQERLRQGRVGGGRDLQVGGARLDQAHPPAAGLDHRGAVGGRCRGCRRRRRPRRRRGAPARGRPGVSGRAQSPWRGTVPSMSRPSPARLSVSAAGAAAIAPSAPSTPSSTASISSGVTSGRAASCTSTTRRPRPARRAAPRAPRPARLAPPGHHDRVRVRRRRRPLPPDPGGAATTTVRPAGSRAARRGSRPASGRPARGMRAFGTAAPMRTPAPAATTIATVGVGISSPAPVTHPGQVRPVPPNDVRSMNIDPDTADSRRPGADAAARPLAADPRRPTSATASTSCRCARWTRASTRGARRAAAAADAEPGEPARRHLRLGLQGVAPGLLPGGDAAVALPGALRVGAHGVRDQRHPLPGPVRGGRGQLGRRDARGLPLRRQGPPPPDPRPRPAAPRGRRGVPRALPGVARAARRPARRRAAPVPAQPRPRRRRARRVPRLPAAGAAVRARVPPRVAGPTRRWPSASREAGGTVCVGRDRRRRARTGCRRGRSRTSGCAPTATRPRRATRGATCWSARRPTARSSPSPSTRACPPATPSPGSGWPSGSAAGQAPPGAS